MSIAPAGGFRRQKRAVGHATRGKTAPNRLRRLDRWLAHVEARLLRHVPGPAVDLGYGETPGTTIEMQGRLLPLLPGLQVVGVEIDRERVQRAAPMAGPDRRFVHGGFDLQALDLPPARLVRAMNVLRQYDASAVADAWALMGRGLSPGGLLVEGTSDPLGRRMVVNLLRRPLDQQAPLRWEATLFSLSPGEDADPSAFQAVLPKVLIHRCTPGEAVGDWMADWRQAWRESAPWQVHGPRVVFATAGRLLCDRREDAWSRQGWLRQGYLLWRASSEGPTAFAPGGHVSV
jgi:hypothetical protein